MRNCLVSVLLAVVVSACGGDNGPPPKTADRADEEGSERPEGKALDVSSEIGALDEGKVDKTFNKSVRDLQACLNSGATRVEYIGGSVAFFVKVDAQGRVSHTHLEQSSLGDRETEKCMLDVIRRRDWPAPQGGQTGLARKSFDFDPPNDVRQPTEWTPDRLSSSLEKAAKEIDGCKRDAPGTYTVTMYVDKKGEVLGAGVAPPDERGEGAVDCLVGVLKGIKFTSPGSYAAKVTFQL